MAEEVKFYVFSVEKQMNIHWHLAFFHEPTNINSWKLQLHATWENLSTAHLELIHSCELFWKMEYQATDRLL